MALILTRKIVSVLATSGLLLTGLACSPSDPVVSAGNPAADTYGSLDVNLYPLNKLVCDPFSEDVGSPGLTNGIQSELFYLEEGQTQYNHLQGYFDHGKKSSEHIFFSKLNVPTRVFSTGFPLESGGVVQTDAGEDLYEYFALRMRSVIHLGPHDEPGVYELALLSDDGSIWKVQDPDGQMRTIVDNDGDHPTRLGCGSQTIQMTANSRIPIELQYYQGPRHHISMIPLWRKAEESTGSEPLCGQKGNSLYFDYNNESTPQQAYKDLLSRGWKPLGTANYSLPEEALFNPCQNGVAPVITDFSVKDHLDGQIKVTWKTDIPATSQVRYVDMDSGAETLTKSDTALRTEHEMILQGFSPGINYLVQAVSISESYGKSLSEAVTIQVQ